MLRRQRGAIGLFAIAATAVLVLSGLAAPPPWSGSRAADRVSAQGIASATLPASTGFTSTPASDTVLIGAGDICVASNIAAAQKTADLVGARPTALVFTLGDNSNESGTADQYATCYGSTWGAFRSRTRPTIGNHDVLTSHGAPYYAYFGSAAGPSGKGYYSYDLAANWHVIVLNSNCDEIGGCDASSPEETWLKAVLAANSGKHILAMWHHPEFSSGGHRSVMSYKAWWDDLYAAHADVVLNGHDHDYERFARQSPDGKADPNGIREFVAGTGGASHTPIFVVRANSEVYDGRTFGVLSLTLKRHGYGWQFIPVDGGAFTDSGETATHS